MSEFIPVCEPMLAGNELEYITDAIKTGWISSSGKYVERFEQAFSEYCGCKYGVTVCNGTVALHLALVALGVGKGDEVIVPSFTMIATAFAVCYTGAKPVFVDADKNTWNIDVDKIEDKITKNTKAIIPVHLFGNPCDMDRIKELALKYNLFIVEDAAEAHGAEYSGKKTGALSDIGCFSFFANKNLTTGEGGMVVTNDESLYKKCKYYKNICFSLDAPRDYLHDEIGFNYRMSNLHAALGLAQTEKANEYRELRIQNAARYKEYLSDCPGIVFQSDQENSLNVHWMNAIVVDPVLYGHTRDELMKYLKDECSIDSRMLFKGMHRQKSLMNYGCDCSGAYPITDWLAKNGMYLPSASLLGEDKIENICDVIKDYCRN